jgi:hypothetical protein
VLDVGEGVASRSRRRKEGCIAGGRRKQIM